MWLDLLYYFFMAGYLLGVLAIVGKLYSQRMRELCHELRFTQLWVFVPGDLVFDTMIHSSGGVFLAWNVFLHLCYWIAWYVHKPDDRWKRRRRKVAAAVKEVAGKLVVVPVLAPSAS